MLSEDTFRPPSNDAWKSLRQLYGTNQTPDWYSPGANKQNETIGELLSIQYFASLPIPPSTQMVNKAIVGAVLLTIGTVAVYKQDSPAQASYIFGSFSEACIISWPLTQMKFTKSEKPYLLFDTSETSKWIPIHASDLNDWRVIEISPKAPDYQSLRYPDEVECAGGNTGVRFLPTHDGGRDVRITFITFD